MKTEVKIRTPYIELDSFLKFASLVSTGGEAKLIIQNGEILVNGEVCTMRKKKLYPGDEVGFEGRKFSVVG
ncbi:MAG: RNA-binding S4 domain-containing protein [Oscillospiraceae bacterium]|nr:RNA-binding S4 domain-containing protein [Oscillospiraceae bacterium]